MRLLILFIKSAFCSVPVGNHKTPSQVVELQQKFVKLQANVKNTNIAKLGWFFAVFRET